MYESYWGLKQPLFTASAARESLSTSPVHAEALARLDFLCESKSRFGLLLGPAGSGKSTVLAEFARRLERQGIFGAVISAAASDELSLLIPLATGLQIEPEENATRLWRLIVERIDELKLEGLSAVVLLDDLDRAGAEVLLLIERLLSLADAPLTIVAAARSESAAKLGKRVLDHAALRIDLNAWDEDETREYLTTSLAAAGRVQAAFDDSAARRLYQLSGGTPRKVNQLAQLALLAGAGEKLVQIGEETIRAVHEELSFAP